MGHYISVRGWLEVDADALPRVKQLIKEFPQISGDAILTPEQVKLYAQGWVVPAEGPNWTRYCFYGADLRREGLACLLAQIRRIGQALIEQEEQPGEVASRYNGVFFVDDDEGDMSLVWYVKDGEIIEKAQNSVVPLAHQGITPL